MKTLSLIASAALVSVSGGTVSLTKGFLYYAEAIFLLRYRNHSMERLPYQTSAEFEDFITQRSAP